ncbi:MAG: oligosaccharide flippase family protein [Anaerolineae bacterium]
MRGRIAGQDMLIALILLLLPLILLAPVTLGPHTLLPADNLYTMPPWSAFAEQLGVGPPHNLLLSDLVLENYVWKRFILQSIQERRLPLWDPYIFAGHPFLANGQHSALYPFSALFYIIPLSKAYGWFTLLQLWLGGLFIYIFLRTLRARRIGTLLGGITFQLSTFFVVSIVFTMIIAAAIWLPLLLAVIEKIIHKQEEKGTHAYSPIPYVAVGAVVLGVENLAGHVEVTYYTLLVSGFYAACRLLMLWRRQHTWRPALRLGIWLLIMIVLGMGLGAIQSVPLYEVASRNFREGSVTYADVVGWALPPRRLISFLIPDFFGNPSHHFWFDLRSWSWQPVGLNAHGKLNPLCPYCTSWDTKTSVEAGAYVGVLPLLLALLAAVTSVFTFLRKRSSALFAPLKRTNGKILVMNEIEDEGEGTRRGHMLIFALLAVLSLAFAFGTPLYALLYYGLPYWNQLHSPFRWIFPFTLSVAVLAGLAATQLGHNRDVHTDAEDVVSRNISLEQHLLQMLGRRLAWPVFGCGAAGLILLIIIAFYPTLFIQLAQQMLERSGLAQHAFADGAQLLGYQWINLLKFSLFVMAAGAVLRISRCPIYLPRRLGGAPVWQPLAALVIAVDLLAAGWGFNPAANPRWLEFQPPVVKWLLERQQDDPLFRITSFDVPSEPHPLIANTPMFWNLFDVRGYDSIIPAQYARYMGLIQTQGDLLYNRIAPIYVPGYEALDSALLDLLGVRYVLTTIHIPNDRYRLVYEGELRVYENLDALPRAFAVPVAHQVAAEEMDYALRSLNPRCKVILEDDGAGHAISGPFLPQTEDCPLHPAQVVRYTPNEVLVRVTLDAPGWLVLADSYFPGWKAYRRPMDSGTPAENDQESESTIHLANGNFRAVYLEAGNWEVRFVYSPLSFKLGAYGSFISAVVILFLIGIWAWGQLYHESMSDQPIKRIAKNSLAPMAMALLNRVIDFGFAMLMLRILTPEGAGRYQFAVVFIGYAEILTRFGLGTLLTREVARDRAQSASFFSNVTILRAILWLASLPTMGIALWLYVIFARLASETVIAVGLFAVGLFFSNIADGLTALFYAHEKAEYPAGVSTITTLVRVSLGALALLLGGGVIGLAAVSVMANIVSAAVLMWVLFRTVVRLHFDDNPTLRRHMLREALPLMINHLLATLFFRIDVLILQPTWGDRAVGFYGAAYKYIDGINIIPSYFTLAIFPLMSRYAHTARDSLIRAYILSLRLLLIIALPLAVGTPFIARELILLLGGGQYLPDSMIALQLLIWFLPFSFINQITQYVLIAIDQQRFLTRAFIIGVLFNTITNLVLIPQYGYRAAAITTILSEWALLIPFYYAVRKYLCVVPWGDIVWRPALAATVMGGCLWLIHDRGFFVRLMVALLVYGVTLVAAGGLRQPDMQLIWSWLPLKQMRVKKIES